MAFIIPFVKEKTLTTTAVFIATFKVSFGLTQQINLVRRDYSYYRYQVGQR